MVHQVDLISESKLNFCVNNRMGSFTSVPAVREDIQDADFDVGLNTSREALMTRCLNELPATPNLINRSFVLFNKKEESLNGSVEESPSRKLNNNLTSGTN